ncbi:MAG: hypothetical protein QMD46_10560, partial [Methanomicrobiales archaeon]|nr:hypothetical protein [Methanomicrobiales archaeon]MDI6877636.1 hypothetical protein [Methanomicrobiales archaeon]
MFDDLRRGYLLFSIPLELSRGQCSLAFSVKSKENEDLEIFYKAEAINDSYVDDYNVIPSRYTSRVMGLGAVQRQSLITLA